MKKYAIGIVVLGVILDQLSKYAVTQSIELYETIKLIPNFFYLTFVKNTGAAWSILEGNMLFFYVITLAALGFMVYYLMKLDNRHKLEIIAMGLLIAGTLGNFIDRLWLQYVRDFIGMIFFGYYFPIFNVADMLLTFGVILMAFAIIRKESHENNR